uniref:Transcription factor AP-2 C-terminal domain-containing protein n=1 Tax=Panagrolaimus sp. PS1159 TaxID=55785 RepID=A0AC35FJ37_9BILA
MQNNTNNKWNMERFGNFHPQQLRKRHLDSDGPPSKRLKEESESSASEGDEENYSPSNSPQNSADTTNPYNGPGPLAHSTPIVPLPQLQQLDQQQMQQNFQNFMNPMVGMDPLMQQQWAAQYQMLQQQQPGYPAFQNLQPPPIQNFLNLNNTHTSGSSEEDDSGNSAVLINPDLNKPANEITFCSVPSRLALLSQNKKIKVSLAEIRRRINAPECLNSSLLSAILRKAKNKEGGKQLASELSKYNISLPAGRRKAAPNTAFTAFVEGESVVLAKDFAELSKAHFPFNSIVYEFLQGITSPEDRISKYWIVNQMVQVVGPLTNIFMCDTSPICDRPLDITPVLHPDSQKDFTKFSLLTHGFGALAHHSSWNTLLQCAKILQNALKIVSTL